MKSMTSLCVLLMAFALLLCGTVQADPPKAPAVSEFAPVDNLAEMVKDYVEDIEKAVESQDEYDGSKEKLAKISNTLILISLSLGLSDKDNEYKASAAEMVKATQKLAAAKDHAAAKAAVDEVKAAIKAKAGGADKLKWEKAASLHELMEAVPTLNTKLKSALKREKRFPKKAKTAAGQAAVIAVIAQGSMYNSGDTKKPGESEKWYKYCAEMRDAATELSKACIKKDHAAAKAAMDKLGETCHTCHEVFHEEAKDN